MSIINTLVGPVTGILDKFIEDKDQKAALAHEIATMIEKHAQQLAMSQIEVNKEEASSGSIFKGGWRTLMWAAGAGGAVAAFVLTVQQFFWGK